MGDGAWWAGQVEVDFLWVALGLGVIGVVLVVHLARRVTGRGER